MELRLLIIKNRQLCISVRVPLKAAERTVVIIVTRGALRTVLAVPARMIDRKTLNIPRWPVVANCISHKNPIVRILRNF